MAMFTTHDGVELAYEDRGGNGFPLIMVIGCDGSHVDPSSQRYIAEQIPDARLQVFPTDVASSHFPFLENPSAFNAVVEEFLDRT